MKSTRITDQITYVEPGAMAGFVACSGLIVQSRKKVFIDMNLGQAQVHSLLNREKPDLALVTHFHLDHSVWLRQAAARTGIQLFVPRAEASFLTGIDPVVAQTAGPLGLGREWKDFAVNTLGYASITGYRLYDDTTHFGDAVPEMVILATPGHSPGHCSFYFPDHKILFSGDLGLDRFGPWYGWQNCDLPDLIQSILRMDGLDIKCILTSHGGMLQNNIHEAWAKSLRAIVQREQQIRARLDADMTEEDIIEKGIFYTRKNRVDQPLKDFLFMWDRVMLHHHMELLKQGGIQACFPELYFLNGFNTL